MVGELVIRPARADEREVLEQLQWRSSLIWESHRDDLLAHPDAIDLPAEWIAAGRVFVAERLGEAVGFCVVLSRGAGEAELDGMFVDPGAMGGGVGRELMAQAERIARSVGAGVLMVVADPHAERFYLKLGFERAGETVTRFGAAHLLRKPLL